MALKSSSKALLGLMPDAPQQDAPAVFPLDHAELIIVEFDDQGSCYDRRQMHALSRRLEELRGRDAVFVAFVHGWKHNASGNDDNLMHFCGVLSEIGALEGTGPDSRPVIGIFIGWRGLSLYGLETENLTFWDRKQAGTRVATGSVRELLGRLRQFRLQRESEGGRSVLVIVGHSFGGLVVYSAIAQSLIEAAATPGDAALPSFANLVLIVNPAFEAVRYLPVHSLVEERAARNLPPQEAPVFVSVTAANDWATGLLFPLGMAVSLLQESATTPRERAALWHTMGHLRWLRTHELSLAKQGAGGPVVRTFCETELRRVQFGAENPFWVVRASPDIINGHDGIFMPPFLHFLQALVFDHVQPTAATANLRSRN
jgi:hypothetical protein